MSKVKVTNITSIVRTLDNALKQEVDENIGIGSTVKFKCPCCNSFSDIGIIAQLKECTNKFLIYSTDGTDIYANYVDKDDCIHIDSRVAFIFIEQLKSVLKESYAKVRNM